MTWSNPTVSPTLPGVHFFSNILTTYPAIFCLCFLSYTCAHLARMLYKLAVSWGDCTPHSLSFGNFSRPTVPVLQYSDKLCQDSNTK